MSQGDWSALLTVLAIPAGGSIAALILWLILRPIVRKTNTPRQEGAPK